MKINSAFTLVELLVVVAIIAILLALLVPAMDKAIYQAELAVCAAQQKSIGQGATQYAFSFHRWYPVRPGSERLGTPSVLRDVQADPNGPDDPLNPADYRPTLMPYIQMKMLIDPLSEEVSLDPRVTDPSSTVIANIYLWFAWKYRTGESASNRLGDRFEWQTGRYSVIVSDMSEINTAGNGSVRGNHPDYDRKLSTFTIQDEDPTNNGTFQRVLSFWAMNSGIDRGPIDRNYTYDDLSVTRFDRVVFDNDPRMDVIPSLVNGQATRYDQLPIE